MASPTPLHGTDLIDCAQANAKEGILVAAHQCGYNNNIEDFQYELKGALEHIGIKNKDFDDLLKMVGAEPKLGIEIAPDPSIQL
jgi:hypothetical protein